MLRQPRHSNKFSFAISQDNYELPNKTVWANGNIYLLFKPINFRDVQNLYQDKASMNITLSEFQLPTFHLVE